MIDNYNHNIIDVKQFRIFENFFSRTKKFYIQRIGKEKFIKIHNDTFKINYKLNIYFKLYNI